MRNIFIFIGRYFNFFLFLILLGISFAILIKFNQTYEAFFANNSNEVTGWVDRQYNDIEYYFRLKDANRQLAEENARLRNMLASSFDSPDSARIIKIDTLTKDTLGRVRKFNFLPAKVVNNSVSQEFNYITLYRGSNQGIKSDMAVIGPDGIVGRVILVSDNYSRVMSLLNRNSRVSAMLKKGNYTGILDWDGKDPQYVQLHGIPKSAQLNKGDSVLTSNLSDFPSGIMIGTVSAMSIDPSTNFFTLQVKSSTNFFTLQYAYIVENFLWNEQKKLETKTPKNQ